jgi:hypothetical protein
MATATRISRDSHETLSRIAAETGKTHQEVIEVALRKYERELFLDRMNAGFAALRQKAEAWEEELEERAAWDTTLSDGAAE